MGNITISLKKDDEQKLRQIANSRYKNKKGSLSKVISESLSLLSRQDAREKAKERQFKWMETGFEMGNLTIKKRQEIYDRN